MLQQKVRELFASQLEQWPMARRNFDDLNSVQVAEVRFDACRMPITFNAGRIRSTAAKVDQKTIAERRCFLCGANRPAEQEGIEYGRYTILINPFPIFKNHLTIPDSSHTDQMMNAERMGEMLDLARDLSDWAIFYNGPKCGASAPDHFHFQAGDRGVMPVEEETKKADKVLYKSENLTVKTIDNYVRKVVILEGKDREVLKAAVEQVMKCVGEVVVREPEPMVNIITVWDESEWRVAVFPRREHRPSQFFLEDEAEKIVFSPGAVDFGGIMILPRKEDFERLQVEKETIADMFGQLSFTDEQFVELTNKIAEFSL